MSAAAGSPWLERRTATGVWRIRADWQEALLDPERGLFRRQYAPPAWELPAGSTVVKQAGHRLIYRVETDLGPVFVKHYFIHGFRATVRSWLRPPKARRECDIALSLQARDIPTVDPVATFATRDGASCIVTRAVADAVPLDGYLKADSPRLATAEQRLLAQELAAFVARLHDAGVTHRDFHPGNLLLHRDETGLPQLTLIDPYEVRLGSPLDLPASLGNLALFGLWFLPRGSVMDRRRFWRYYWLERRELDYDPSAEGELLREFERKMWRMHLRRWRQRDARCLGENRDFYRVRRGSVQAWAVRDLPADLLERLMENPDGPFADAGSLLKASPSSTVAEVELPLVQGTTKVICKRFQVTKWSDPVLTWFRDSPAMKSWRNGHRLQEVGLPTARPLAVLHRCRRGCVRESYLLTEKIPQALGLHEYMHQLSASTDEVDRHRRREMMTAVARLLRQLHRHQVSHHDLKAANVLVSKLGATPRLYLIDLYGMRRWRRLPRRERVQNLMRLYVSFRGEPWLKPTECLRFLRSYLQGEADEQERWKEWWRAVVRQAARKVAQNQRRGRPLS